MADETTQPAPVPPTVAAASVAPTPTDESSVRLFGQDGVESAYREVVELATVLALDPEWTLHDGDNEVSDLDAVLAGRYYEAQAGYIRDRAEACDDDDAQACFDVLAQVLFDLTVSAEDQGVLEYRPDGEFVTAQSLTDPTVTTIDIEGTDGLRIAFAHTATMRMISGGTPLTATMTRHLSYDLWPAPAGNAQPWWIVNWSLDYEGEVIDETTGEALA
ncbi:hypothetical protein [Modestobacter versicolor]|uniref:Uncharacterized protein n=1 Tax=Modestobacter versicolor TaxID=429133 RepID=A0A323VDI4_9ACTN|nr:hypothetical protein [Modestobacter versicolor]MBB3676320.1 hypothetical protein [Modestobacter versicolor]PZA22777.1 hypothetical protein DMO24_03445 [Modestobacter versicolor]